MIRKLIQPEFDTIPAVFHPLLKNAKVYDSSCSDAASVFYIDWDGGYYLKCAPAHSLNNEVMMTRYLHRKGRAAEVLDYITAEKDWMLTTRVPGEDCTHPLYLNDPKRLCETTAHLLRELHESDFSDCPVPDRTTDYLTTAEQNYQMNHFDTSLFPDSWCYSSADKAWAYIQENRKHLKTDTLLHGDYCLPNIMLDNWKFTGFIDLDCAGVGDKHIDLFWGAWTLTFNLKTDTYKEYFLDAYGRADFEPEMLRLVAALEAFR